MYRYKLLEPDLTTYGGCPWTDPNGKFITVTAKGEGTRLCSEHVIHFYDHPVLAVLLNPLHAKIKDPILARIRTTREVNHDGLKGGCKAARIVKLLPMPSLSADQKAEFAIRLAKTINKETMWNKWADNWLSGRDRSSENAKAMRDNTRIVAYTSGEYFSYAAGVNAMGAVEVGAADAHVLYVAYAAGYAAPIACKAGKVPEFRKILISILKEMNLF